jgi:hypothetical protein
MKKLRQISSASTMQKKQEGDYWDSFLKLNLFYDKRNQKVQNQSMVFLIHSKQTFH